MNTAEGLKGLTKDKAAKRKQAIEQALATIGGKLDAMYWALGEDDAYVICDSPDNVSGRGTCAGDICERLSSHEDRASSDRGRARRGAGQKSCLQGARGVIGPPLRRVESR